MRERPTYEPIPRERIQQARQTNIAEYLISRGEPLVRSGNRYKHAKHDSLVFTGNAYYWNSRSEHGNAVDFLMRFYNIDFWAAIKALTEGGGDRAVPRSDEQREFNFKDIEFAPNLRQVIDYLTKERKISVVLVLELIAQKRLFQELKTNNAIFPIYDTSNNVVGAEMAGIVPDKRFKGVKSGSKYGFGYNLTSNRKSGKIDMILFFESAIDLLSFVDLTSEKAQDIPYGCLYVSMSGLKENIVAEYIKALPDAQPFLCVDNDAAGTEFTEKMKAKHPGIKLHLPAPQFKDWNEQLKAAR